MLKELRLVNWKSFRDATLYIDPLTIIIGMNASGKSNVLDALLFLQRIASGTPISIAIMGDAESPSLRGGLEWAARKPEREFELEILVGSPDERIDYRYSIGISVNGNRAELASESLVRLKYSPRGKAPYGLNLYATKQRETTGPGISAYFNTGTKGPGRRLDFNRTACILNQVDSLKVRKDIAEAARVVIEQLRKIFILDPIPMHMRGYEPLSDSLQTDAGNIAGVLAGLPDKRRKEVEATLTDHLKRLPEHDIGKIWTERVGKFESDAMLYCEESWGADRGATVVDARGMSDGTLRFLAIVSALLTLKERSLLVVEEVDNGLHPARAHVLVNMLKQLGQRRSIDVIVTTHNPAMLNALGNRMVPFVTVAHRSGDTGESHLTLLEEIERLPKLLASGGIGTLSEQGRIEEALQEGDQGDAK